MIAQRHVAMLLFDAFFLCVHVWLHCVANVVEFDVSAPFFDNSLRNRA